jgi:hypothetical protein
MKQISRPIRLDELVVDLFIVNGRTIPRNCTETTELWKRFMMNFAREKLDRH